MFCYLHFFSWSLTIVNSGINSETFWASWDSLLRSYLVFMDLIFISFLIYYKKHFVLKNWPWSWLMNITNLKLCSALWLKFLKIVMTFNNSKIRINPDSRWKSYYLFRLWLKIMCGNVVEDFRFQASLREKNYFLVSSSWLFDIKTIARDYDLCWFRNRQFSLQFLCNHLITKYGEVFFSPLIGS